MNDRVNAWLDGEIPLTALDAAEQEEARALARSIAAAAARLSSTPAPDLTARVMTALPARPAPAAVGASAAPRLSLRARLAGWLRGVAPAGGLGLRPAMAMAALTLTIGFALGTLVPVGGPADGAATGAVAGDEMAPRLFVRFELEAAGAADVRLAGSFTDWEPRVELTPVGGERWTVTVPLEPGVHDYVFVVDGDRHVIDPYAPRVADGFGGFSSRLALLSPAS